MSVPHKMPSLQKFRVTKVGSIFVYSGLRKAGDVISSSDLPEATIQELIRDRKIVPVDAPEPEAIEERSPVVTADGSVKSAGVNQSSKKEVKQKEAEVVTQGNWKFNPVGLQAKSLEELNALIIERDTKIVPFATKEEAIGWLSQDFK